MRRHRDPADDVARALAALPSHRRVAVAYSGGLDSHVLLDAAVRAFGAGRILALHVDHGLQSASAQFAAHCRQESARLGVPIQTVHLQHRPARGESIEAWARDARYAALAAVCGAQGIEWLLTAHHADDQAETLMLRLGRGTGLDGLAGIEPQLSRDGLQLVRPLLAWARDDLERVALARGLRGIIDPSNADRRFQRNAIRHSVLPALEAAIPGARATLARAAEHLRQARDLMREVAQADLATVMWRPAPLMAAGRGTPASSLDRMALRLLAPARRAWALRAWLTGQGLRPPSTAQLDQLQRQLIDADAPSAHVVIDDHLVLRLGNRLMAIAGAGALRRWLALCSGGPVPMGGPMNHPGHYAVVGGQGPWGAWEIGACPSSIAAPHAQGTDAMTVPVAVLARGQLRTEPGDRTGLRLRTHPGGPSHTLKNLYQAAGIPGWLRPLFPVLASGERAVCSPALGVDASARPEETADRECLNIVWVPTGEPPAARQLREICLARHPVESKALRSARAR